MNVHIALSRKKVFVEVLLPTRGSRLFTYELSRHQVSHTWEGCRAAVPFQDKIAIGIVWRTHTHTPSYPVKQVCVFPDEKPTWDAKQRFFITWLSQYYMMPLGKVVQIALQGFGHLFKPSLTLLVKSPSISFPLAFAKGYEALVEQPSLSWQAAQSIVGPRLRSLITPLIALKVIGVVAPWKASCPKLLHVTLSQNHRSPHLLPLLKSRLEKKKKQLAILQYYLKSTARSPTKNCWIPLVTLLREGNSATAIRTLLKKNILVQEKRLLTVSPTNPSTKSVVIATIPWTSKHECVETLWQEKPVVLASGGAIAENVDWGLPLFLRPLPPKSQALYLLPAGQAAPSWLKALEEQLGNAVAFYSPSLSAVQKQRIRERIAQNQIQWLIGSRTALFLPFPKLARLVVVEAQAKSHSPQETPYFNGRDAAIMLAHHHQAVTLLTASVASLESYLNVKKGKYGFVPLPSPPYPSKALQVIVNRTKTARGVHPLSTPLRKKIAEAVTAKRKVVVLHHRRGYATYSACPDCRWIAQCSTCQGTLVSRAQGSHLYCYLCKIMVHPYARCPDCQSVALQQGQAGTEQLTELFAIYFPNKTIVRLDSDVRLKTQAAHLSAFQAGKVDILVTTPHHIKQLPSEKRMLVVIPAMDRWLQRSSFRAEEQSFQWLTWLIRRKTHALQDEVWLQTSPRASTIIWRLVGRVLAQEASLHYEELLIERLAHGYPPYKKAVQIILYHPEARIVKETSQVLLQKIQQQLPHLSAVATPVSTNHTPPHIAQVALLLRLAPRMVANQKTHLFDLVTTLKKYICPEKMRVAFVVDSVF